MSGLNFGSHVRFVILAFGMIGSSVTKAQTTQPSSALGERVIRVARSSDGKTFRDTGVIAATNASAPGVCVLPNGHLLAVVDMGRADGSGTYLGVTRSRDGQSWSEPRAIQISGRNLDAPRRAHGEPLAGHDGSVRLFFSTDPTGGAAQQTVGCAVTRDGLNYRLDEAIRLAIQPMSEPHSAAFLVGGEAHLFIADVMGRSAVQRYTAVSGRLFRPTRGPSPPGMEGVRSIVAIDGGYRAYIAGDDGVRSMISKDGSTWTAEDGICLTGRWDPAVVSMPDRSFLMLYGPVLTGPQPVGAAGNPQISNQPGPPPPGEAQDRQTKIRISMSNLKGLATQCHKYAADHNGNMPPDLETLVTHGAVDPRSLISPLETDNLTSNSYVYIPGQHNEMDPANILAYEKSENHGGEATNVLFIDGHAEYLTVEEFEKKLEETYQRLGH